MTRINADLPPHVLSDWHLIAEINEIPRVAECYYNRVIRDMSFKDLPKAFTLGKGHMLFFLDKGAFIKNRYKLLMREFLTRGYNAPLSMLNWQEPHYRMDQVWHLEHENECNFSQLDRGLVVDRIINRIKESPKQPYYQTQKVNKEFAINLLLTVAPPYSPQLTLIE